jgi:hypothetical protein
MLPSEPQAFAVSVKSYKGKIPARTGWPAFTYIRTAADGSTVAPDPNIRGVSYAEQYPKAGEDAER